MYMRSGAIRRLTGVAAVLALAAAWPVGAGAQTLEEALVSAYQNNPQLQGQRARLRATDEQVNQALSNWRPSVDMTAETGAEHNYSSLRATNQTESRDPKSIGLTLSQPLFRGGRTMAETSAAENSVKAERARLHSTEQQVLLDAATAYMNVFRDQAILDLNRNNEQVLQRQLEAARDRFEVGEITRTDVHQAEARLARSRADRIQSEADLEASRAAYQRVVGTVPRGKLELPPLPANPPPSKDTAVKEAVMNNPDVIAAQYDERAAVDDVDTVWGELLPELELSATATRDLNTAGESSRLDSAEALVTLTVPLYQSGSVHSRVREAKQTAMERRLTVDSNRRDAAEVATRAFESLQAARARLESFRAQIQAAEIAFEGVEREAAVGARTVLDVLDAEQELLDARVSYIGAQRDEAVATFELLSAVGRLTAHGLELPVELYDPDAHYREVRDKLYGTTSSGDID